VSVVRCPLSVATDGGPRTTDDPMQIRNRSNSPLPNPPHRRGGDRKDIRGASRRDGHRKPSAAKGGEGIVPEIYQVVIECRHEREQRAVYERMRGEGFRCRVLTL
jgi:hypothetical protein